MLSPAPSTVPSVLPKPSTPTLPSPLLPNCSPSPASSSSLPLVDISVTSALKSTSPPLPSSPPFTNLKPVSPHSKSASPLNPKLSSSPAQKPMFPQVSKPIYPPLPTQQPSSIPKVSPAHRPPPRPSSKPSSPPLPRPPPPVLSKASVTPAPAEQPLKPAPPSISVLDKLIKTCPVWLQLGMSQDRAIRILNKETPGIFLVRRDTGQKSMIVVVRLADQQGEPQVQELKVKEEKALLYLEGSVLVFDNIFKLIAFYCVSRDILPFTLKLPQAIVRASKYEDMEVISTLGLEFWNSSLNSHIQDSLNKPAVTGGSQDDHGGSCEIQLSVGGDRLWYVNPIFIEEYCSSLPSSPPAPILRTQSLNTPVQVPPKYKRPPPLPPRPITVTEGVLAQVLMKSTKEELTSDEHALISLSFTPPVVQKEEGSQHAYTEREGTPAPSVETETVKPDLEPPPSSEAPKQGRRSFSHRIPPVPLRRRLSENQTTGDERQQELSNSTDTSVSVAAETEGEVSEAPVGSLICLDDNMAQSEKPVDAPEQPKTGQDEDLVEHSKMSNGASAVTTLPTAEIKKPAPVPPPRRKRPSPIVTTTLQDVSDTCGGTTQELTSFPLPVSTTPTSTHRLLCVSTGHPKVSDVSLFSPEGGAPQPDHDSYSTSSTEEEVDAPTSGAIVKRTPTIMLDRAKQRLSMVNFSNVFTTFMNADRKLQKRIVELSRDGTTYFGNLVQDYRAYTLDTMRRHLSSTEMLQEIRQMMTQLKSYLIQSAELQNLQEPAAYSEDKLEIIIEAGLCKSVLKPLKEAIYNGLKDIHSRTGTLKSLKENQQIVLSTTTTDLGVTTGVPDTPVMEKIQVKLGNLHQEYSPQKKIDLLLKTCKMIYESMSVGCSGKVHGADDFLPVLMYVLARCNMAALLLDVEYMMELMDPALQLGEGSYYLTTTYGALEHIKSYDKQAVTRQLSLEVQDSIHRWERRRTLNKARASRSSVQDFINVSFLEAGSNTKTLGVRPNTTAQDLSAQCAEKFEVLEPDSYCLTILVDGHYQPLTPEEFPLIIKSKLHHSELRKEYYFVYRHGRWPDQEHDGQALSTPEPTPDQEDSLI